MKWMRLVLFWGVAVLAYREAVAQPAKALATFAANPGLKKASWGFALRSTKTGKLLLSQDANRSLAPASCMKVVTTAAALRLLGPEYRVYTELKEYPETRRLTLTGVGDPSLGSGRFSGSEPEAVVNRIVKALDASQNAYEAWSLVVDTLFARPYLPDGYTIQDRDNYFGAPAAALNWRENFYKIELNSSAPGKPVNTTSKYANGHMVFSAVTAGPEGSPDLAYIYQIDDYNNYRLIKGSIPPYQSRFTIKGAQDNPAKVLAAELEEACQKAGMVVSGPNVARGLFPWSEFGYPVKRMELPFGKAEVLDRIPSPTLAELVRETNTHSLNLYAECVLRWCGLAKYKEASTEKGCQAVSDYWVSAGLDPEGYIQTDGSGLSLTNSVTPYHLAQVMGKMDDTTAAGKAFKASLPVMGRTGTLASMGKGTKAEGNIRAKSGTLTRVLCYTGYVTLANGEKATFAVMVNRYSGGFSEMKKAVTALMVGLCE